MASVLHGAIGPVPVSQRRSRESLSTDKWFGESNGRGGSDQPAVAGGVAIAVSPESAFAMQYTLC